MPGLCPGVARSMSRGCRAKPGGSRCPRKRGYPRRPHAPSWTTTTRTTYIHGEAGSVQRHSLDSERAGAGRGDRGGAGTARAARLRASLRARHWPHHDRVTPRRHRRQPEHQRRPAARCSRYSSTVQPIFAAAMRWFASRWLPGRWAVMASSDGGRRGRRGRRTCADLDADSSRSRGHRGTTADPTVPRSRDEKFQVAIRSAHASR